MFFFSETTLLQRAVCVVFSKNGIYSQQKKTPHFAPQKSFAKNLRLQSIRAEKVAVLSLPPLGERDGRAAEKLRLYNQWGRPRRNVGMYFFSFFVLKNWGMFGWRVQFCWQYFEIRRILNVWWLPVSWMNFGIAFRALEIVAFEQKTISE